MYPQAEEIKQGIQMYVRQSDTVIVLRKFVKADGEKDGTFHSFRYEAAVQTRRADNMVCGISEIQYKINKANRTDGRVQNLAVHINEATIAEAHKSMLKNKASGIDGVTKTEYSEGLKERLENLVSRLKNGTYRPNPSKRVYIPKAGSDKKRPLGISCYEDKLVENVIAKILTKVYEPKFCKESFGFRPGRSCHMAIREVIEMTQYRKTNFIVEADIRGFFDNVDHDWLLKMLEHDIADRKLIEIIRRFLKAGIMECGKYTDSEKGTPQGNGASPVLANIYLHYVLDLWFDVIVKRRCKGECYLIRYADDFVCCFQNKGEAEIFLRELRKRFAKFGLELAEEKTKILEFGRFAEKNRKSRGESKPETFDFLGFTFYCGKDSRKQFFRCRVRTSKKKFRSKVREIKEWIKGNRTKPLEYIFDMLRLKLKGYYNYYCVTDNIQEVKRFLNIIKYLLYKWLNRRSEKRSYTWEAFNNGLLKTYPLPEPRIVVSLFYERVRI